MVKDAIIKGLTNYINQEILPNATQTEKMIICTQGYLGILDTKVDSALAKLQSGGLLSTTKLFDGEELNLYTLKNLLIENINTVYSGRYVFPGWDFDLIVTQVNVFQGYVINESEIVKLFDYIFAANQLTEEVTNR